MGVVGNSAFISILPLNDWTLDYEVCVEFLNQPGCARLLKVMGERESSNIGECTQAISILSAPQITEVATVQMYFMELNPYSEPDLTRVKPTHKIAHYQDRHRVQRFVKKELQVKPSIKQLNEQSIQLLQWSMNTARVIPVWTLLCIFSIFYIPVLLFAYLLKEVYLGLKQGDNEN